MYRQFLGDKYDGTPLRHPPSDETTLRRPPGDDIENTTKTNEPNVPDAQPIAINNEPSVEFEAEIEQTSKQSTQVKNFRESIQKIVVHSKNRRSSPDTQQPIHIEIDDDEDLQNREYLFVFDYYFFRPPTTYYYFRLFEVEINLVPHFVQNFLTFHPELIFFLSQRVCRKCRKVQKEDVHHYYNMSTTCLQTGVALIFF